MSLAPTFKNRGLLLLLLCLAVVWFGNLQYRKLVRPDEGRYAEIPREMAVTGNWITPRLDGLKYFEKPPLQYWATAAAYRVFGQHQWSARLWGGLTGFLGILLIYFTGRKLFGPDAGFYAALVLGSSLLYVLIGHINTLDMGVTFFMSLSLAGFLLAQRDGAHPRETARWMYTAWAATALAVLSKGLIGIVLPGAALVIYTLIHRDWALWKRLRLGGGLLLFFAIAAPWFVAVSLRNPDFFHFFFVYQHFDRFLTKDLHRYHPWWYFVPILVTGVLPWLVQTADGLLHGWEKGNGRRFYPKRFLLVWAVSIYVFFSISDSKLPSYILPIFPAFALLMGERLTRVSGKTLFWQTAPMALLAAAALALSPFVIRLASPEVPLPLYEKYRVWLIIAAVLWLSGVLTTLALSYRGKIKPALIVLAATGLVCGQLVITGHDSLSPASSSYAIAQQVKPYLKPGAPFYSVGMYPQTLPFYIKRTVTLVAYRGELAFGVKHEPHKWLPTALDFETAWRRAPYALAIMQPNTYKQFKQEGLPMIKIAQDTRRIVVKTP
ncbi:MAG TPA: phospholipid carrier-dependent glycosyltransferase [Betaproteobacteria bacterium]|nr:phospholipid carrier-dependent glycosyltransferase [Betaproteobacteria bacterium]